MLSELIRYAQREGLASEPGFKTKMVKWLILFDPKGRFTGVALQGDPKGKGEEFAGCPDLTQPEMIALGKGTRHFLVDSLDKVVLLSKDDITPKLTSEHEYFVNLLKQASIAEPLLQPIADVLSDNDRLAEIREQLLSQKAKPTDGATVAVSDAMTGKLRIFAREDSSKHWWRGFRSRFKNQSTTADESANGDSADAVPCFLSGQRITPARTHPKIAGLSDVGGLAMGDAMTSFDKDAFASFGLEQGQNAAVSEEMAAAYTGALNHLIRNHSRRLAGLKITYWYSKPVPIELDPMKFVIGDGPSTEEDDDDEADRATEPSKGARALATGNVRTTLESVQTGEPAGKIDARFYALTLSANSGRVVVRDWMESSFESITRSIDQWFDDLSIVGRRDKEIVIARRFKFLSIVGAGVRDLKDATAVTQLSLWKAALTNQPIPEPIAAMTLRRAVIDIIQGESPQARRFALLKAYLKRKGHPVSEEINDDLNDPAYLCGRILALLARAQYQALGDVGAGVVQRYYAAASTTPGLVLGRLIKTANTGHIPKIDPPGLRSWYEQQLAELWSRMSKAPPSSLTLQQQTLFAMGYYQQLLRKSKEESK
jgi:CRISPR-associated protein Csd1